MKGFILFLTLLSGFDSLCFASPAFRCGKSFSALYGSFHSPGFPLKYYDYLLCTWTITVGKGYYIELRFTAFDVEYYPNCTYDYVQVVEQGRTLGKYCGRAGTHQEAIKDRSILKSKGNRVIVRFLSDYSNEEIFRGFKVHYKATDIEECRMKNGGCDHFCHDYLGGYYCSCRLNYELRKDNRTCQYVLCKNVQLRALRGTITSPEYPKSYPQYCNCSWKISVPRGYRIVLEFKKFKIETHPETKCPYDHIYVHAGRKHGPLCGRRPPRNITSTSNSMTVRFVSDGSKNLKGFLAVYHTEGVKCPVLAAPVHGLINASGFSFKDEANFSCLPGYIMKGASRVWCRSTAVWTKPPPICQPVSCGHPGVPRKASMHGRLFTFNETVRFQCDPFYEIDGEDELVCEEDGRWSDELPECVPVCGNSTFANIYRDGCRGNIVGGNEAARGSYPWHALLKLDGSGICGASLLNENWIITAAHCVINQRRQVIRPFRLSVVLGLHNKSMENETQVKEIRIGQVYEHRAFNPRTFEADFALLRLTEPAVMNDYVKPICLPDTDSSSGRVKAGARGVVAGWGRTASTSLFPDILQEVCLPVINTSTCRGVYRKEGFPVTHDMFCAGPPGGGKDVCKGDSGGGFIMQDPGDSRWFLAGLVSWGSTQGCALPGRYSVYLEVEKYLDWILDRISM